MFGSHSRRKMRIRTAVSMQPRIEGLEGRVAPSTFKVNTVADTLAVSVQTGKDASGHISLRSAIMSADAKPNSDTITLPAGTFTLTIPGAGEDKDATGDLDIRGNVTIKGKGAGTTVIDGNFLDRVIQIASGKVTISGVTLPPGDRPEREAPPAVQPPEPAAAPVGHPAIGPRAMLARLAQPAPEWVAASRSAEPQPSPTR